MAELVPQTEYVRYLGARKLLFLGSQRVYAAGLSVVCGGLQNNNLNTQSSAGERRGGDTDHVYGLFALYPSALSV